MYERILVPLDGSEYAERAVAYVAHLPSRTVRLLRVEPAFQRLGEGPLPKAWREWREESELEARTYLNRVSATLRSAGSQVELVVRYGDPADEIIREAEEADLVVMTTRGRGAVGRAVFGSVADRVVRHGTRPTILLRGDDQPIAITPPHRIIVALDGSPLAEAALPVAARLASELGRPIHLVRVVDTAEVLAAIRAGESTGDTAYEEARAACEREAAAYLDARAAELAGQGLTVDHEIRGGHPVSALLDLAQPSDLLVVTSHGHGGVRRWLLGSVAEKLIRHAHAPVLLVRAPDEHAHNA